MARDCGGGVGSAPGPYERLWLDQPDAAEQVDRRSNDSTFRRHALELIEHGVTRIDSAVDPALCDRVRADYERYCQDHAEDVAVHADASGHRSRFSNLHLVSDAASDVGTNTRIMDLLDYLLGYRAAVYSSLTFERGSQQAIHRDSPYLYRAAWVLLCGLDGLGGR